VEPIVVRVWCGVGGAVIGLVAGTIGSGGDSLAFWTASLAVATLALVGVTSWYAALLSAQMTEQLRPLLVWDCYHERDDECGIFVRNVGRTPATLTTVKIPGFETLEALTGFKIGPESKSMLVRLKKADTLEDLTVVLHVEYRSQDGRPYVLEDTLGTVFATSDFMPRVVSGSRPKA